MDYNQYVANSKDLKAIEEGLLYVNNPQLDFIFKDRNRINNTLVITYDSKNLYYVIFNGDNNFNLQTVSHNIEIGQSEYRGWRAGLKIREFTKLLPKEWQNINEQKIISGGPLTPFIEAERKSPIYNTYESFLATIIHEFGHIYYNSFKENSWYFSDKKYNMSLMEAAIGIAEDNESNKPPKIRFPKHKDITEVFAFCTDYSAASIFWPNHKDDIDTENVKRIKESLEIEKGLDYSKQDTTLDDPHLLACVIGTILIKEHGLQGWVDILLSIQAQTY